VRALVQLLDSPAAIGDVFNVGSQREISIRALADLVIQLAGSGSGVRFIPYGEAYEPGFEDMERRLPDISKIARAIGWRPTLSLEDIVQGVIDHELERALAA